MKKHLFLCLGFLSASAFGWTGTDCVFGKADREIPVYGPGERMTFTLETRGFAGADLSGWKLQWTRTGDDGRTENGEAPASKPFIYGTSLDRPGFVRLYAELVDGAGKAVLRENREKVFFDGGAGVDILKIRQGVPEPSDFDAFWARRKAKLAEVAWQGKETVKELPSPDPAVALYEVGIPCAGGMPATGYLSVPKAPGRYPARISFWGYGASWGKNATEPPKKVFKDEIELSLSAHGFRLGQDAEYYRALRKAAGSNGYGHAFDPAQNADPDTAYFAGMTYRVMRGLEYLKSRPEWNGRSLRAVGGSQGGLQSIWAAALDHDVTQCNPAIPWCCDIGGTEVGRNRGTWYVKWVPALGYYDPVNMAKRIPKTCTLYVSRAGLGDYICPPTGVMAFYNNLTCPKSMVMWQNSEHGYVPAVPHAKFTLRGDEIEDLSGHHARRSDEKGE